MSATKYETPPAPVTNAYNPLGRFAEESPLPDPEHFGARYLH
jgi:hypothetical protein